MPAADDRWIKLVAKLNAMTQDGNLVWDGPFAIKSDPGRTLTDYYAKYKDKAFRVRKGFGGTKETAQGFTVVKTALPTTHTLAIVDIDRNLLFGIPDVAGIQDLYESVVYQRAGIKDMLDDLLKDD